MVCKVAVDDKGGGEASISDVRGTRVEAWPEAVLKAAQERNAAFRLLILRRRDGEDRYSQVDLAQVDLPPPCRLLEATPALAPSP